MENGFYVMLNGGGYWWRMALLFDLRIERQVRAVGMYIYTRIFMYVCN